MVDDSPNRELGDTEKPEVKYIPQHRRKEKLEEKMIELIDLTSKQTAAEMAPPPPQLHPLRRKIMLPHNWKQWAKQCETHWIRGNNLNAFMKWMGVLYRHVRQAQFPLPNQQNYGGPVDGGIGQQGQQGPMMRELNFQGL